MIVCPTSVSTKGKLCVEEVEFSPLVYIDFATVQEQEFTICFNQQLNACILLHNGKLTNVTKWLSPSPQKNEKWAGL